MPSRSSFLIATASLLSSLTPLAWSQVTAGDAAQTTPTPAQPDAYAPGTRGRVDVGAGFSSLTDGNSNWNDQYVRGYVGLKPGTTINWALESQRHFSERGTVAALSLTQDLSPLWYASAGMSFGDASFQNKYRVDAGLYRKWGDTQQWVTGLALMKSKSRDHIHRDTGVTASVAYYSTDAWVAEGGIVYNRSNPGSVDGFRGFAAFTQGQEKQHYLTLRVDHGKEGYLPVGASGASFLDTRSVGFQSTEVSATWRQWIGRDWGYLVGAQFYRNPYYNRKSLSAAVFFDF